MATGQGALPSAAGRTLRGYAAPVRPLAMGRISSAAPVVRSAQGGQVVVRPVGKMPSAAGTPSGLGRPVRVGRGRRSSAASAVLVAEAAHVGDNWRDAGFPSPDISGYSYEDRPGLKRTKMYSGAVRQRKAWPLSYYLASVTVTMPITLLPTLRAFIVATGEQRFTMGLVTGNAGVGNTVSVHTVRLAGTVGASAIFGENISVTLPLEVVRELP